MSRLIDQSGVEIPSYNGVPLCFSIPHGPVVYFLLSPGLGRVKIGQTRNYIKRISKLATMCPEQLVPLCFIECNCVEHVEGMERAVHYEFQDDRVWGEWFRFTDKMADFIIHKRWEIGNSKWRTSCKK